MNNTVIALGIDQGIANLGYCVIETKQDNKSEPTILKSGVLETTNSNLLQDRIWYLYQQLDAVLSEYTDISIIGTESLFVNNFKNGGRNKSAAIVTTNMITGVIMLLGAKHNKLVKQYTPGTVKKYITGAGDASKGTVEDNLAHIINKSKVSIQADHQSDAIAIAWTSSMDVMDNGLDELTKSAICPKNSKKSQKPKFIRIKEFNLCPVSIYHSVKNPEHIPYYSNQLNENIKSAILEQAINGRFNKSLISVSTQTHNEFKIEIGYEVGKKYKGDYSIIGESNWLSCEYKGQEIKNLNRLFGNLNRKINKETKYKLKPDGRIVEILNNQEGNKVDIQILIEVEPT